MSGTDRTLVRVPAADKPAVTREPADVHAAEVPADGLVGSTVPAGPQAADPAAGEPAAADSAGVETVTASDDSAVDDEPAGDAPAGAGATRDGARIRRAGVLAALAVVTVGLAVLTASLAVGYQRGRARAAAEAGVLAPAKTAAARILSYDYRHIEQDAAQTSAVLTGVFRGQYEAVMRQQIVPQAPKQRAVVQAEVLAAGVTAVSPDGTQAVVLIFANQTVSNTSASQPRVDQVRVRLTLDRVGASWLVSKVDAL
jgi:Mce-associated membrane protein